MTSRSFVIVGHVDHGKSTLIGRLLADTGGLSQDKKDAWQAACLARNTPNEYSYLLDAFQNERNHAITIDCTEVVIQHDGYSYTLIDAPGHREFLSSMISGASRADAALIIVDVVEGLREQTRRHISLLPLLGIGHAIIVINKMDGVHYSEQKFQAMHDEIRKIVEGAGLVVAGVVPISARHGVMLTQRGKEMPWYQGPILLGAMADMPRSSTAIADDVIVSVQDSYSSDGASIAAMRVESGILHVGDTLTVMPGNRRARLTGLRTWPERDVLTLRAGEVAGAVFDIPLKRGDMAHGESVCVSNSIQIHLFWLSDKPLHLGDRYILRQGIREIVATVSAVEKITDSAAGQAESWRQEAGQYHSALVTWSTQEDIVVHDTMKCVTIYDDHTLVACGQIEMRVQRKAEKTVYPVRSLITPAMRATRNGHEGGIFWLTGLPASGKTTLAKNVEAALFAQGMQVLMLDGDTLRDGLSRDLGFNDADRAENIRRAAEVAAIQASSGHIVLAALVSPNAADRSQARDIGGGCFHEIYVQADLETCEARDPKGLYKRARAGALSSFTGIGSPYEASLAPDLTIDTTHESVQACTQKIIDYVLACTAVQPELRKETDRVPSA